MAETFTDFFAGRRYEGSEDAAVSVAASGDTKIVTLRPKGATTLRFHFAVATQALDNFDVFGRAHRDAADQDYTPANWTAPDADGPIIESSGNLAAVAAAAAGYFMMDVTGLESVTIKASAALDSASVTFDYSMQ